MTIATILISLATLYSSLAKDRRLHMREQANEVRHAAGTTLATLDRVQHLADLAFIEAQPLFIEVSQHFDKSGDVVAARDLLWQGMGQIQQRHEQRIMDERIENGYTVLLAYDPDVRALFRSVLEKRRAQEAEMFSALLAEGEGDVDLFHEQQGYTPAMLGGALRRTAAKHRERHMKELSATLWPLQSFLTEVLSRTDEEIVSRSRKTSNGPMIGFKIRDQ